MADDSLFPGGIAPTEQTHPLPGAHNPQLGGHEAPPGMDPGRDPLSDADRDDDWVDSTADEDIPPADEPTPLSDDLR
ncbi:hypothetical protein HU727_018640 [Pseudomonas sp. SWRI153]|uniref:Uncharacterized protein n=1 Tax=Pseudomonas khorasanensis TaxID=2745508 RepID=A0A923F7C4_9PSED|nr:hypothetical protein [Pseudomonas khorasanensis]MBV4487611.1 hypothetical protein [Pseudomonas khorasanensis]